MGYKFSIEYKKVTSDKAAAALSRREEGNSLALTLQAEHIDDPARAIGEEDAAAFVAVAQPMPTIIDTILLETSSLPDLQELSRKIPGHLTWVDGIIYFNRRILISPNSAVKKILLREHHSTPLAGHPGHERTFRLLAAGFFWPKMRKDVKQFVDECVVCQSTKYSTQKPAGLLQPLPVPSQVWEDVSMDFITGLPQSRGYTTIMVVVDRLSKYAHFAPLPTRFDALRVAHLFVNTVVRHHGFPKTLVSDRDSVFLNAVWEEILRMSGTKLHFSTAYHPQSDGQTEVRNRGLEQYLRAFTADKPSKWANFLPWAELALNCFYHAGLGMSPFRALYGRDPPTLVAAPPSAKTPPNVVEMIRQRGELLITLRRSLESARQRMADSANRHRRHVEFEIGELVWLKLQPYRQHLVARPQSAKLARRYYGPFEILERIGPVAYRLRLPDGSRIHNVFHVSLLREFVAGEGPPEGVALPVEFVGSRPIATPVSILDSKVVCVGETPTQLVLVQWSDGSEPSWETREVMQKRFPDLPLEDKQVSNGEGVVRNTTVAASDTIAEQSTAPETEGEQQDQEEEVVPDTGEQPAANEERSTVETRKLRPRDTLKAPAKFQNYSSK